MYDDVLGALQEAHREWRRVRRELWRVADFAVRLEDTVDLDLLTPAGVLVEGLRARIAADLREVLDDVDWEVDE